MYLTIQGIVLRVTDYNDKDALLTMLTRRHGRLTVKARGLRRKNSPLIAPCQLLAYGEFTLFEYRGQYTINEAQSIELFTPLRRDLTKLSLGTYFAQVSEVLSQEDMPNPELQSPAAQLSVRPFQGSTFRKVRSRPCSNCAPPACPAIPPTSPAAMSAAARRRSGSTCRRVCWNAGIAEALSRTASGCRAALRAGSHALHLLLRQQKAVFLSGGGDTLQQLSEVTEAYLATQLERGFSTLDFYKSLLI